MEDLRICRKVLAHGRAAACSEMNTPMPAFYVIVGSYQQHVFHTPLFSQYVSAYANKAETPAGRSAYVSRYKVDRRYKIEAGEIIIIVS